MYKGQILDAIALTVVIIVIFAIVFAVLQIFFTAPPAFFMALAIVAGLFVVIWSFDRMLSFF